MSTNSSPAVAMGCHGFMLIGQGTAMAAMTMTIGTEHELSATNALVAKESNKIIKDQTAKIKGS